MKFKTCTPCRLPLKHLDWERLVPWIGAAREALARFDESLKTLSFHDMETMIWEESIASLRGQNIQASLKEVLQFAKDRSAEENRFTLLQKIVNAQKGLKFAIQWAKRKNPIGLPFFCKVHAIVKQDAPNPKEIGKLRKRQNWIGVQGCKIEEAYFYPPRAGRLKRDMQSLIRYGSFKEKDPLVQLAIYFAQLLVLHPFMDGNGRVARIFIPVWLYRKGLISQPMFFLSRYFEQHRLQYFQKLFYISEKRAWEDWIIYFLKGVIDP